jgi:hypothetical protein
MNKKIIICGDTHGYWTSLNELIENHKPDEVWVCGDFGYWPRFEGKNLGGVPNWKMDIKTNNTIVRFCPGNHEDWEALRQHEKDNPGLDSIEVLPNVFYQKRGSYLELPDKRRVLFMGGAESIDKNYRIMGYDWFPDETISYSDVCQVFNQNCKTHIVISHTCPIEFLPPTLKIVGNQTSMKMLSAIHEELRPDMWFFGHFHVSSRGRYEECNWFALNMEGEEGFCLKL